MGAADGRYVSQWHPASLRRWSPIRGLTPRPEHSGLDPFWAGAIEGAVALEDQLEAGILLVSAPFREVPQVETSSLSQRTIGEVSGLV